MALSFGENLNPLPPEQVPYELLTDLSGVGTKLARRIMKHYTKAYERFRKYGQDPYDFGRATRSRPVYGSLGEDDVCRVLAINPYRLVEVRGINFKRADEIARDDYGFGEDAPERHRAGNRYSLGARGVLENWKYVRERQKLRLVNPDLEIEGVVREGSQVWLPEELHAERYVAHFFMNAPKSLGYGQVLEDLGELNEQQRRAVQAVFGHNRVFALTGGAGTGKTRTLAQIAIEAERQEKTMRIMTLSGKAAMRADEALREGGADTDLTPCTTIHRALGMPLNDFAELEEDIIVLDEASMISNGLFAAVLKAMRPDALLILVGDPHQLPPIGYGTPFRDYLELKLPEIHLTQNYRQANQQSIFDFAEAVRTQDPGRYKPSANGVQRFFEIDPNNEGFFDAIIRSVESLGLHEWSCVSWTNNIVQALNLHIQSRLNPTGQKLFDYPCWDLQENGFTPRAQVRIGDRVMVTDNDYTYGVFNGQTGVVTEADFETLTLDLQYRTLKINLSDASDLLCLGYVTTVHKAQGSGWQATILYQPFAVGFDPRRFYYTAATRAQEQLYIVSAMSEREFWSNVCQAESPQPSTLLRRIQRNDPNI